MDAVRFLRHLSDQIDAFRFSPLLRGQSCGEDRLLYDLGLSIDEAILAIEQEQQGGGGPAAAAAVRAALTQLSSQLLLQANGE